jgi:manganese transport protein
VALNVKLVLEPGRRVGRAGFGSGRRIGPLPAGWLVAAALYGLVGAVGLLLAWITIKPWWRPAPAWKWAPGPDVELDWADALRPHPLSRIGVALEHSPVDAEILGRALGLAGPERARLVLLHVVDTPMTHVYGADTADQHTGADERYLAEVVRVLEEKGYAAEYVLLYGPDRAAQLVGRLRRDPVDLLVVGSHGHRFVRDLLLGQTVDKVRHGLDIPMLVTRPGHGRADEPLASVPARPE